MDEILGKLNLAICAVDHIGASIMDANASRCIVDEEYVGSMEAIAHINAQLRTIKRLVRQANREGK